MEQDLKQRLIGVTIIVALVVIFVPMLFDENPDKVAGHGGIPPIPSNVMESTLELPKSADDVAPKEEKQEPESGFRIVPLTDPPTEKPEPAPAKAQTQVQPSAPEELEGSAEEDFTPQPEKPAVADEKPVLDKPVDPPRKPPAVVAPNLDKPAVKQTPEKPVTADAKKPKPVIEPTRKPETGSEHPPVAKPEPIAESARKPKPGKVAEAVPPKPETAAAIKPAPPKPPAAVPSATPKSVEPSPSKAAEVSASRPTAKPAPMAASQTTSKPDAVPAGNDVWVIQAGSFTSEEKAKALADKLRQSKFPAFIESATSDHGPTYRVQIGPELDRGRAEQIQSQMESNVGIRGIIVPHP